MKNNIWLLIFGFFFCWYLYAADMTFSRLFESSDGQVMYETTRRLALDGRLDIEGQTRNLPQVIKGQDGLYYSKYDPGLPLLAAPLVKEADAIALENEAHRYYLAAIAVKLVPAFFMALGVTACGLLAEPLYSRKTALGIALVAGGGTTASVYGTLFFAEAVITGMLSLAVLFVYKSRQTHFPFIEGASLALGLMILTRASSVIYLPVVLIWCLAIHREQRVLSGVRLLVFPVLAIEGLLLHNWIRFDSVLLTGYEAETRLQYPLPGIVGLLVSPGKSVFLYAPPLILSGLLFPRFRRRYPQLAVLWLFLAGIALLFYGSWWAWHGGWVWGPRFLVPLMPLWCIPLGELPGRLSWRIAAGVLVTVGVIIQIVGAFIDITPHYAGIFVGTSDHDDAGRYAVVHYDLFRSPLNYAFQRAASGEWEHRALFQLNETGLPGNWTGGVPLVLGILAGFCSMGIIQVLWQHSTMEVRPSSKGS